MTVEEKIKLIMSMIKLFIAIIVLIILFCLDIFYLILILKEMFKNRNSIYILIESKYLYYWSVGFILMFIPILCNESDGLMSLFLKLGLALSLLVPVYYIIS